MNSKWTLYFWAILYTLCPVLDIHGHFLFLPEFYTYIIFIMRLKDMRPHAMGKTYIAYVLMFGISVLFTALLARSAINNYDLFVIRNAIQIILCIHLYDSVFVDLKNSYSDLEFEKIIMKTLLIFSIPAFIVFLERINLFSARALVQSLYKPQFYFLSADTFASFRYTSVFKDFFTGSLYFISLSGALFHFALHKTRQKNIRLLCFFLLIIIYMSQFFVARSGLVFIPFFILLTLLFAAEDLRPIAIVKRLISAGIIATPIIILILALLQSNVLGINLEWAKEAFALFSSSSDKGSSFHVMQNWMGYFIEYLKNNKSIFFIPMHTYTFTVTSTPSLYTDSFYIQEIFRYGIYGLFSYFIFIALLIKHLGKKHIFLIIFTSILVILNYKGGNVFFMPRNIYLYAFIFALFFNRNSQESSPTK